MSNAQLLLAASHTRFACFRPRAEEESYIMKKMTPKQSFTFISPRPLIEGILDSVELAEIAKSTLQLRPQIPRDAAARLLPPRRRRAEMLCRHDDR